MDGGMFLPEFDREFAETRRALERVPQDRLSWKPHDKSYSLHELAFHLSDLVRWTAPTLEQDLLDLDEMGERPVPPDTVEGMLAHFDEGVAEARKTIEGASEEQLAGLWEMKQGGEVVLAMPKAAVLRSFILNHNVHHRAQLGVYLRLLDVQVPGHYGPSADEM
jgi:uncharacterized damage-inducible protein DinB